VRTIKLFAVIGLAVALVAVPALAARVTIQISGTAQAGDLFIQVDSRAPVPVTLTAGQAIAAVRNAIVSALNNQQAGTAEAIGNDQILINADKEIKIGEAADKLNPLAFQVNASVTARGLTFRVVSLPTLTEWGLIALAVLLAGGMGYMIYRRRPALRPAAP
jgi:hypothetical protein